MKNNVTEDSKSISALVKSKKNTVPKSNLKKKKKEKKSDFKSLKIVQVIKENAIADIHLFN